MLSETLQNGKRLPAEQDTGNIEYKLFLHTDQPERLEHYISQLKYRLSDTGQCTYLLGVEDDGHICGVERAVHLNSLRIIAEMVKRVHGSIVEMEECAVGDGLFAAEVYICSTSNDSSHVAGDVKVLLVGPKQSGKSTLVGVLTRRTLDNGEGSARTPLLRHRHELLSGMTHSRSYSFLYMDEDDDFDFEQSPADSHFDHFGDGACSMVRPKPSATRVVHLIDTPGFPSYTPFALLTCNPDAVLFVFDPSCHFDDRNGEVARNCNEFKTLCEELKVPYYAVYTHSDVDSNPELCPSSFTPNFLVSLKTGHNLNQIWKLLRLLQPRTIDSGRYLLIEQFYQGSEVGLIASGRCFGHISMASSSPITLWPSRDPATLMLTSIHRMRMAVSQAFPGQYVAFALESSPACSAPSLERGMILIAGRPDDSNSAPLPSIALTDTVKIQSVLDVGKRPMAALPLPHAGTVLINGSKVTGWLTGAEEVKLSRRMPVHANSSVIFVSDVFLALIKT